MIKQNTKLFNWISTKTKLQMSTITMLGGLLALYQTLITQKNITTSLMITTMIIQIISLTEEVET